jgi:hypothetical protein
VAGYVDGRLITPSYPAMVARYPGVPAVSISADPYSPAAPSAIVADCEDGDYTPALAASWAKTKLGTGRVPCLYCSSSAWSSVQSACIAVGVDPASVDWWIAAYPGIGAGILYPGSIAHQWIDHGTYDESVVVDGWVPGRPVTITPPPPPGPAHTTTILEELFDMPSDNGFAVRYCYRIALHREVDPAGFTANVNWLNAGGSLNDVLAHLQDSAEGQAAIAAERKVLGI